MIITISGKHMDIGQSLQQYVNDRLNLGIKNYLHDITQSKVVFSKNHHLYHADIIIHDSHIGVIKAEAESDDVYAAFDVAIVKIERQLRKYKGRIKKHSKSKTGNSKDIGDEFFSAVKYILNNPVEEELSEEHEPITIAEHEMKIECLTVSEAIMKMDLANLPALLFINKLNARINLVYHRHDGNISWVDPGEI
jgi:ribosomal subunit interface protein